MSHGVSFIQKKVSQPPLALSVWGVRSVDAFAGRDGRLGVPGRVRPAPRGWDPARRASPDADPYVGPRAGAGVVSDRSAVQGPRVSGREGGDPRAGLPGATQRRGPSPRDIDPGPQRPGAARAPPHPPPSARPAARSTSRSGRGRSPRSESRAARPLPPPRAQGPRRPPSSSSPSLSSSSPPPVALRAPLRYHCRGRARVYGPRAPLPSPVARRPPPPARPGPFTRLTPTLARGAEFSIALGALPTAPGPTDPPPPGAAAMYD